MSCFSLSSFSEDYRRWFNLLLLLQFSISWIWNAIQNSIFIHVLSTARIFILFIQTITEIKQGTFWYFVSPTLSILGIRKSAEYDIQDLFEVKLKHVWNEISALNCRCLWLSIRIYLKYFIHKISNLMVSVGFFCGRYNKILINRMIDRPFFKTNFLIFF